uniref:Uncharacterized protein n=1 Tax=Ditylenchus dipsaci TaxID=166011 RepID=A0A915E171_9BILA
MQATMEKQGGGGGYDASNRQFGSVLQRSHVCCNTAFSCQCSFLSPGCGWCIAQMAVNSSMLRLQAVEECNTVGTTLHNCISDGYCYLGSCL